MISAILIILLIVLLLSSVPHYDYSRNWGYAPSGIFAIILFVFVVWLLFVAAHHPF